MSEALSIHHDQAGHQFETTVDGHRAYLAYMDLGKQTLDIYRTFVPNALRGRGIAAALTERALGFAEDQGYTVIPSCSYVERYIERRQRHAPRVELELKRKRRADARRFRCGLSAALALGSTSLSLACMLRRVFSVVSQSMQASVMETPYLSWSRSWEWTGCPSRGGSRPSGRRWSHCLRGSGWRRCPSPAAAGPGPCWSWRGCSRP